MNTSNMHTSDDDVAQLRHLILGMRTAYQRGENAMQWARDALGTAQNPLLATLIAYDLQAGSYVASVRSHPDRHERWCLQLATLLERHITVNCLMLEVGCGEATTLAGVLACLPRRPGHVLGLDISWSRCTVGIDWLAKQDAVAKLFVADLFRIPLANASIDVIYTSHSLEPNGGREEEAIKELLRVSRRAVILVEPIYELADPDAQSRMRHHGYVRGLKATAERLGAVVTDYRLLETSSNPLNPSGVVVIEKAGSDDGACHLHWQCPITHTPLHDAGDAFISQDSGLTYPVLREIPLLRAEHAVIASTIGR